ncbi:MAG: hypothetical protein HZA32_21105 [Opitutae bacterium]|nr:hypothetical protein [Opitutae bacterium]
MKALRLSIALLMVISAASLGLAERRGIGEERRFASRVELEKWAEKESFGGYSVRLFSWQKHELLVVERAFTSGVESCMLSFYVRDREEWVEAVRLRPWWGESLRVKQDEDVVRVLAGESEKEVGIVSISGLQVRTR